MSSDSGYQIRLLRLPVPAIAFGFVTVVTYGPSPGRAIGFFGTWLVYIVGSLACLYYSVQQFL
ncbi:MAPEG family protein [Nostoc sphaeroides]|uniref:Glutathione S-transferase n=1 Tax=Nostoc sphaeroides CCNUC1 TaxID=2653204 RepID=A0A5P8W2L0_9NOSO|nr:MAPEG family protein [Nostoc sphaeroides]MCC5630785.1 MAPEG family protein [Nostoc sphaeroides CHAB 2801]QFS46821.1 glutathione S-transferase [Nostoc sphaeroides CCNUC1]